ncbi:MAG TPA: CHASE3 domain-containing protein [Rhizomicrobium sp.]
MRTSRFVLLAALPSFVVLAAMAAVSYRFAQIERAEQIWVVHTYRVMDMARAVLSDVEAAETGQRGFLITHDGRYLDPYRNGVAGVGPDLARLQTLTIDNAAQQVRVAKLRALVRQRLSLLDRGIMSAALNGPSSPDLIAHMQQGKDVMDAVRVLIAQSLTDEQQLLVQRTHATRLSENHMVEAALAGTLVALIVLLAAALLLFRNNRELVLSERQRTRQAAILQATLDSIREGLVVFDAEEHLRAFNDNFFRQTNFPRALAREGVTLAEFRDAASAHCDPLRKFLAPLDGAPEHEQIALGDRVLEIYRDNVPDGGSLIVCMDVTARVRNEAALRQAQKMEAVGQLTGGVAHDFNNLLQIIGASLDLITRDVHGRAAERMQNAMAAVNRGARLSGQLLAFARRQTLAPRSTNVGRLIVEMTDLIRRTLGERVETESIIAGGLWNTLIDPHQVENAVLNLAINARDAMPDGGKLTIEVGNAFLDDAYATHHHEVTPGQYVMIAVTDTGMGMSADVMARVFEPFFTTKPEGQGTGLGLSQVYGFVKQSSGHVKIYSEAGQGTTVKLYLPRTRKPEENAEPVLSAPPQGGSETILVVEDDEGVRAAVVDMLGDLGYNVLKAANAEQALTVLSSGAGVDLLFTDVVMPGPIPTRELARRAQQMIPGIAVLFTSGYTQNAIVHNGRLDDDVFLLSKPYRRDDLAWKLRSLLNKKGEPVAAVSAPPQAAPATAQGKPPQTALPRKVLVVEDVALIRMSTLDMLSEIGIETAEAGNGTEALECLDGDADIDVLLTDLGLPGMSGAELVAEARKRRPDLRIIVASGYSSESYTTIKFDKSITLLPKPFDLAQLRKVLT